MKQSFILNNARFTVYTDSAIRMEYANNGVFVDACTMFALRNPLTVQIKTNIEDNKLIIETSKIKLTYIDDGKPFSPDNLKADINAGGMNIEWNPETEQKNNLGGTLATLDGCDGDRELPDGILSRDGWYVIDDSNTPVFTNDWIESRSKAHIKDLYLFGYGHDYKEALRSLSAVSGKVPLPRKTVFGSWYSRWYYYTSEQFKNIVKEYDEQDFPLDTLVIDMDWHYHDWNTPANHPSRAHYGHGHGGGNMGWTGYSWNKDLIPDPAELIKYMKDRNITVTLNDHPADGIRDNEDCYPEFAKIMGLDAANKENIPFDPGSKKYMDAFFTCIHEPNEKMGVDFWWVDWQQDYIFSTLKEVPEQKVLPWLNYLYYNHSKKNGRRGMSFSRFGGWGDHRHPTFFSGDCASLWPALDFEVAMTVTSGNALCFWWSHDIGGFFGEKEPEMYVRWVQFGITSPSVRLHSCGEELDRRPWTWDEVTCKAIRKMFHLRSEILPYIYSSAYQSSEETLPLLRPLYLQYPEVEEAYKHRGEYFFGDGIICAPITAPGEGDNCVATKEVWLPKGVWYNYFTGEKYDGGNIYSIICDLYSFPLFVKAGIPIPMQPYTNRMTSEPLNTLRIRFYPGEYGKTETFILYEDDGQTEAYLNGEFLKTHMTAKTKLNEILLSLTSEGKGYNTLPEKRDVVVEIPCCEKKPTSNIGEVSYNKNEKIVYIKLMDVSPKENLDFEIKF